MTEDASAVTQAAPRTDSIALGVEQQRVAMSSGAAPMKRMAKKSREELEHAWQARKEAALRRTGLLKYLNPRAPAYAPLNQAQSQPGAGAATPPVPAAEHSATDQTAAAADLLLAQLMGSPVSAGGGICTGEAII